MNRTLLLLASVLLLGLNSCVTKRNVYVKDMVADSLYTAMAAQELNVQKGDRLSIVVSAKNPELAAPFNNKTGAYSVGMQGEIQQTELEGAESREFGGYLVDSDGAIEFPVLGKVAVEGLSLTEVKNRIHQLLVDGRFINEPLVHVEMLNFKVVMLGELSTVGVIHVPDRKITLLEAISRSRGLTQNGRSDRVTVIREENGTRRMIVTDIEGVDVFNSPAYYLQQNDIVYVEPRAGEVSQKTRTNMGIIGIGTGVLSVILLGLNLIIN